jgi:hypothetical protein
LVKGWQGGLRARLPEFGQMTGVIPGLLALVFFLTGPWSILFIWMGNNTKGSLLLACVFHGSQAWFTILVDPANMMIPYLGYMAVMTVTAIVVVLICGAKNLSHTHKRIMFQDARSAIAGDAAPGFPSSPIARSRFLEALLILGLVLGVV